MKTKVHAKSTRKIKWFFLNKNLLLRKSNINYIMIINGWILQGRRSRRERRAFREKKMIGRVMSPPR